MTTSHICIMIAIIVYLGAMIYVGYLCSKKNNDTSDFYLGGRKLGPLVTAMSAEASDMSSWLLMGLPGLAYLSGIADAGWTAIGLAIGTYLNWKIVAKRIRLYTHVAGNSITLPSFFSNRFRDNRHLLQSIGAIFIVIFFIPYTASGFAACGKLFSSLFGVKYLTAMIISALVIVGYTTLGGFLAASTTDFIQSIIMSIALIIVFCFGVSIAGGPSAVIDHAKSLPGYLTMMTTYDPVSGTESAYPVINIVSMMAWGLGYFGMPHILLRFMAIEDEKKLSLSRRVATTWVVISLAVAVLIGVIGLGMTEAGKLEMLQGSNSETIIVKIADLLSTYGVLPALLGGTILAGILASTMSTADSQLLAASSSASQNILKEVFMKDMSEKTGMLIARITVLIIALIGVFIAVAVEIVGIPVLPFSIGLYLPIHLSTAITVGGLLRAFYERKKNEAYVQDGILFSSGLIAGEGLIGILLAVTAVLGVSAKFDLSGRGISLGAAGSLAAFLILLVIMICVIKKQEKMEIDS